MRRGGHLATLAGHVSLALTRAPTLAIIPTHKSPFPAEGHKEACVWMNKTARVTHPVAAETRTALGQMWARIGSSLDRRGNEEGPYKMSSYFSPTLEM